MRTATHESEPHVSIDLDTERVKGWMNGAEDTAEKVRRLRGLFGVARQLASTNQDDPVAFEPDDFFNLLDLINGHLSEIEQEIFETIGFMSRLRPNDAPKGKSPTLKAVPSRKSKEG